MVRVGYIFSSFDSSTPHIHSYCSQQVAHVAVGYTSYIRLQLLKIFYIIEWEGDQSERWVKLNTIDRQKGQHPGNSRDVPNVGTRLL